MFIDHWWFHRKSVLAIDNDMVFSYYHNLRWRLELRMKKEKKKAKLQFLKRHCEGKGQLWSFWQAAKFQYDYKFQYEVIWRWIFLVEFIVQFLRNFDVSKTFVFYFFIFNITSNKCLASSSIYKLKTKQKTTEQWNGSISTLNRKEDRGYTYNSCTLL